ncbi:hypothetical protein DAPPUDRAFT_105793 [Daphnia pulex]|uniref:Uncharacterized protein n=1 Tax=Daphnia pulex TaxID=6669 RepID=E9GRT7_DAPPU|nr:hypothetical protein DAPPUDRAFT_105793 [Daphnia pulex]|eukprot:EFX77832.1 hypothetical protein DAPPUDRAFT_105793 [Daphnia pulex]
MGGTKGQNQKESQMLYIALRNRVTSKVKLVEISKVSLSPIVQYPPTTNPVLIDDGSSNMEKQFVHRFGMLKGQRMYDQAERLTVKAENVKANLENAAIGTAIQDSELVVPKSSDSYETMLPPRNTDTKLPSQVYQIENIVSENDMTALEGITLKLMADESDPDTQEKFKEFSVYFTKEFSRLMKSSHLNKEEKLRCLKALLYTECLIKCSAIKKKSITRDLLDQSLPTSIPDSVRKSIKDKFVEGWTLSKMSRDKIICHAIALALAVGSCSVDAESFSSSLKLDMQSLENLIRVVGARTDKDKSNGVSKIVLKIPLTLPPQKRGQMKRKERR